MIAVDNGHDKHDETARTLETITKTASYFNQDPNHDFNHALKVVGMHFKTSVSNHVSRTGKPLDATYNRSVRGEFLCTSFLDGISVLSQKNKIDIMWDNEAANHNKDICYEERTQRKEVDVAATAYWGDWNKCINMKTAGTWQRHKLKLNVS